MDRPPVRIALIVIAACLLGLFLAACGSSDGKDTSSESEAALERYRSTLKLDAANLVVKTGALAREIEAGDLGKAQSRYATSRVRYSQLEPLSEELFPGLDLRIDAYSGEVPANQFGGFHRIEKALFDRETTSGMAPVAKQLLADVEELRRRIRTVGLQPAQIVEGASAVLGEVPASMVARDEEPYAHADLVDVAANVEGSEAAFKAVKPLLVEKDPQLVTEIEAQFAKTYAALDYYGTLARDPNQVRAAAPGAIFVVYDQLSQAAIRRLAQPIEALAKQLSQVPALVAGE